jgi:hypothetical protein
MAGWRDVLQEPPDITAAGKFSVSLPTFYVSLHDLSSFNTQQVSRVTILPGGIPGMPCLIQDDSHFGSLYAPGVDKNTLAVP